MKKRYQIFVSSTFDDLTEERKSVSQALLECDCIPAGMELFPASNKKSWEIIKKAIDESDYYLLIIAGRYGSLGVDDSGKKIGYTEMEYNYALETGKPIIAFIHNNIDELKAKKVEETKVGKKRLEKFKKKIQKSGRNVKFWDNIGGLISDIKMSIPQLINDFPSTGWIKGDDCIDDGCFQMIDSWKLTKIYNTRAEKNAESDPILELHNTKQLDGIAFGLRSFRSRRKKDMLECLNNGMNVRLLAMNPYGEFIAHREAEENVNKGNMSNAIIQLVSWATELNEKSKNGKIKIKYYNCMTLDFYWRMDDILYVGPYMLEIDSQQTVTFKYENGGKGFKMYSEYFEDLWNNENFCCKAYIKN